MLEYPAGDRGTAGPRTSAAHTPTRLDQPWSRVLFRGRIRSSNGLADREFELIARSPNAAAGPTDDPVAPADDPQPAPDDLLSPDIRAEWQQLADDVTLIVVKVA